MREFTSYGPPHPQYHYCVPRDGLVTNITQQLLGNDLSFVGSYLTIWAPRQTGKTWVMNQVWRKLNERDDVYAVKLDVQHLTQVANLEEVLVVLAKEILCQIGETH